MYMFRYTHKDTIKFFLDVIYDHDTFITVANVSSKNKFSYPDIVHQDNHSIVLHWVFHPLINNPVKNDITLTSNKNMIFLIGPNMAGKSSIINLYP